MTQHDPHEKDGGVSFYPADAQRQQSYDAIERQATPFEVPVFYHADHPHERLYIACLDGTGNDETKPQFGPETNVARIKDQIHILDNSRIQAGYVPGPGTQDGWLARTRDGITGGTYDERLEEAYKQFIDKAWDWKKQDPQAEIRVVGVGFSRGGSEEAGLARLIDERGIQDPSGAHYKLSHDGLISGVSYTKAPLVAPGQVAQAELLFDPVATGAPQRHDRRPPPSVISGFQIVAADERRSAFKSDRIIDPGMTPDGRFLGVAVAGAHSDVGGSYARNGLGIRSENLGIDYLNAFSDTPFLVKQAVPDDPRMNVVHRSEETFPYDLMPTVDRLKPGGYKERLVPQQTEYRTVQTPEGPQVETIRTERPGVRDPFNAEPGNEALARQFDTQAMTSGPLPAAADAQKERTAPSVTKDSSINDLFESLGHAAVNNNQDGMRAVGQAYLQSNDGQALLAQGQAFNVAAQAQAALQAQQQAALQAQQAAQQNMGFSR